MANVADDNTPYKRLVEQASGSVPNASSGGQNVFIDSADNKVKRKNSSGVVTVIEGGAGADTTAIHDNESGEISALTEKTTLVDNDLFIIEDSEASNAKKKVKKSNVGSGGTGKLVQRVHSQTGASSLGTTTIPIDDTIPQNTEGTEFLTLAITPTNAANILYIDVTIFGAPSGADWVIAALFQDSVANALAAGFVYQATGDGGVEVHLRHKMAAGTTSATTFKVRVGASSGNFRLNGNASARLLGGVLASSIAIDEIVP